MLDPDLIDSKRILELLPHRYPFVLVDRVQFWTMGPSPSIKALKNVTINEPFFQGHFPVNPIMPGVLIVEALVQAGAILAILSNPEMEGRGVYLTGIDKVKFRGMVIPGDQLILEVEFSAQRKLAGKNFFVANARAHVNCSLVTEAELKGTVA